jgi:hypothetical protein
MQQATPIFIKARSIQPQLWMNGSALRPECHLAKGADHGERQKGAKSN